MAFWIWPALLLLILVATVFPTAGGLAVAMGFLAFAVLITSWTWTTRRAVTVRLELPTRLVFDETTDLIVKVTNRSPFPAGRVRVQVRLPSAGFRPSETILEVSLPGRATHTSRISVVAHGRGRWTVPAPDILVTDPWGVHGLTSTGEPHPPVIVLPALVPVRRAVLPAVSPLAEVPDRRSLLSDPTAIVGVRPYRPGDPLRSIHWPATAAVGTLVRRETERAWARDLLVVLDLSHAGWARGEQRPSEAAITVAASLLVDAILTHRQPAGLITSMAPLDGVPRDTAAAVEAATAANYRVGASRSHLDSMLVHLATSRIHPAPPFAELIRRQVRLQQPGTTVAIVTGALDEDVADAVRSLRGSGAAPVVLQVANPYVFEQLVTPPPTGGAPRIEVVADRALERLRL